MIGVATGKGAPRNGTDDSEPAETLPMLLKVPMLVDWSGGVTLLGLGDIVLPGLLLSFALRADYMKRASCKWGYYWLMCLGYWLGLIMAIVASRMMQMGQPALLYLVPCTLIPFALLAWNRGEFAEMWEGPMWSSGLSRSASPLAHDVEAGDEWEEDETGGWDRGRRVAAAEETSGGSGSGRDESRLGAARSRGLDAEARGSIDGATWEGDDMKQGLL